MTLYSWKCTECKARGKRWFRRWYGAPRSPVIAAGLHTFRCPKTKDHPHSSCPNHMIVSKESPNGR